MVQSKPKVFVTREIPDAGLKKLEGHCELDLWREHLPPPAQVLRARVRDCHGILSLLSDRIDGEVMDAAGETLRVISNFAVGYNNIDIVEARRRGIQVGNTPGVLDEATADLAVALILIAARRVPEAIEQVRSHQWLTWEPRGLLGCELKNKTLGIFGMGRIGLAVAERMHFGWGMRIIYTARSHKAGAERLQATRVESEELLTTSDVISIHCDLNPSTQHLFDANAFRKMKPTSILVNTSRGGVIDQTALADALRLGRPWAAALDVTDPEPLPAGHPLLTTQNCCILPHIGSATHEARDQMAIRAAENLLAGLRGVPLPYPVK